MKKRALILGTAALLSTMAVQADDIRIDQVSKLQQEGTILPFDKLNEIAMTQHPGGTIGETELDQEYGRYIYSLELSDAKGVQWDIDIDASNGQLLSNQQDD